jgi:hypothetical protein
VKSAKGRNAEFVDVAAVLARNTRYRVLSTRLILPVDLTSECLVGFNLAMFALVVIRFFACKMVLSEERRVLNNLELILVTQCTGNNGNYS